jgi:hypothetical protein
MKTKIVSEIAFIITDDSQHESETVKFLKVAICFVLLIPFGTRGSSKKRPNRLWTLSFVKCRCDCAL